MVRVSSIGLKYSAPCNHCCQIIKRSGIKKIVYSKDNGEFEIIQTKNYNSNFITSGNRYFGSS